MLFMGDAGRETEVRLLASHQDLKADVLKVGHHGSAYSSSDAFVRAVQPGYAVVSVGRHNLFGHPETSTMRELQSRRVVSYRTDENGATIIESSVRVFGFARTFYRSRRRLRGAFVTIATDDPTSLTASLACGLRRPYDEPVDRFFATTPCRSYESSCRDRFSLIAKSRGLANVS